MLGDDALTAELACVREHGRAVGVEVLREADAIRPRRQPAEPGTAMVEPLVPEVRAIEREQVEGIEEHAGVSRAAVQLREVGDAVITAPAGPMRLQQRQLRMA